MVCVLQTMKHSALLLNSLLNQKREHMKRVFLFATVIMAAWTIQSCGDGQTGAKHEDAVDSAQAVNKETAPVDKESSDFAVKAADGGMLEVQMGQLAQEKGTSPRVKAFGELLVKDHSKANDELKAIAANKSITLPDSVGADYTDHINDMKKKSGKDFDKHFIDMMVSDHNKDVDMFEKASSNLTDPELKTFAANTLPTLKAHQDSAKAIQDAMKK
jgi:putative membrane protein